MTRRAHEPTPETRAEVVALTSFGIPETEIAGYLQIDPKTVRKYYRNELDTGALRANAKVGKFLFCAASGDALEKGATYADCVRAAMFWAKTRMRWREADRPGEDDDTAQAVTIRIAVDND